MLYWICNATFHPNYEEILHFANVTFCQTLIFTQTTKENIQFTLILSYFNTNCQDFYLKSYNLPNLNICKNVCKSHNLHTFCLKLARHATICLIYNENPTFYQTCYTCFPPFCDIMPNFQQQFCDIMPNFQQQFCDIMPNFQDNATFCLLFIWSSSFWSKSYKMLHFA